MGFAFKLMAGAVLAISAAPAVAQSMPLPTFLAKADSLKKKGPLALFSGDLKLLKKEMQESAKLLRAERLAGAKAGKKPAYCPPEKGGGALEADEILSHLNTIPAAQRARMTTKDGFRSLLVKKFPCQA
jgi:hypothetical protein